MPNVQVQPPSPTPHCLINSTFGLLTSEYQLLLIASEEKGMLIHLPLETRRRLWYRVTNTKQSGLMKISSPSPWTMGTSMVFNRPRLALQCQADKLFRSFMFYSFSPAAASPCFSPLASASGKQADTSLICLPRSVPTLISSVPTSFRAVLLGVYTCTSIYDLFSQWINEYPSLMGIEHWKRSPQSWRGSVEVSTESGATQVFKEGGL